MVVAQQEQVKPLAVAFVSVADLGRQRSSTSRSRLTGMLGV